MSASVKKYNLTVFGDSYTIVSDEPEMVILAAATHVEKLMQSIASNKRDIPIQKVAVLAALKVAFALQSLEVTQEHTKAFIQQLVDSVPSEL